MNEIMKWIPVICLALLILTVAINIIDWIAARASKYFIKRTEAKYPLKPIQDLADEVDHDEKVENYRNRLRKFMHRFYNEPPGPRDRFH